MRAASLGLLFFCCMILPASAQDAQKEIQRYRQMVAEGSPAELFELEGESLWKKPQGPNKVSLEKCDLGQGAGVLKGAYAGLPRYFKDADRVMDLETRLLHCMTTVQGRTRAEATARLGFVEFPALATRGEKRKRRRRDLLDEPIARHR